MQERCIFFFFFFLPLLLGILISFFVFPVFSHLHIKMDPPYIVHFTYNSYSVNPINAHIQYSSSLFCRKGLWCRFLYSFRLFGEKWNFITDDWGCGPFCIGYTIHIFFGLHSPQDSCEAAPLSDGTGCSNFCKHYSEYYPSHNKLII